MCDGNWYVSLRILLASHQCGQYSQAAFLPFTTQTLRIRTWNSFATIVGRKHSTHFQSKKNLVETTSIEKLRSSLSIWFRLAMFRILCNTGKFCVGHKPTNYLFMLSSTDSVRSHIHTLINSCQACIPKVEWTSLPRNICGVSARKSWSRPFGQLVQGWDRVLWFLYYSAGQEIKGLWCVW